MRLVKEAKAAARNEIQLVALAAFALGAALQMIDPGQNINRNMTVLTNLLLAAVLLASSLVALWGSLSREIMFGFTLEVGGWVGIIIVFGTYLGVAVATNPVWYTAISSVFFEVFIIGSAWRGYRVVKAMRRLSRIRHHEIESVGE